MFLLLRTISISLDVQQDWKGAVVSPQSAKYLPLSLEEPPPRYPRTAKQAVQHVQQDRSHPTYKNQIRELLSPGVQEGSGGWKHEPWTRSLTQKLRLLP